MLFLLLLFSLLFSLCEAEQIVTLFVHGIADSQAQGAPFKDMMPGPFESFDFDDSTNHFWRLNVSASSLGQKNEIKKIAQEWQRINRKFPHADGFILIGISRGASALINFVATHKPKKVKALILDSPFDSIESLIKHQVDKLHLPKKIVRTGFACMFWKLNFKGIFPIKVIRHIHEDIPILFLTIEDDHLVPNYSTQNLIKERQECGYQNMYHIHLMHGRHGKLLLGPDTETYKQAIHAFFAQHSIPYNETYAQKGKNLLKFNTKGAFS
jgi:hypothetical protein